MAGIQWKGGKLTLGKFVATQRHNAKEERVERSHRNVHIDTDKTPDNWSALGLDFRERVARLNARLDEIDVGRKSIGKNERVVAQSLIAYCPPEVVEAGDDAMHRFFDGFWDICSERFGAENLVDMDVHVDEVHEYVDPITHEVVESRPHCHLTFVPCVSTLRKRIEEPVMRENPETGEMEPVRNKNGKIKRRTVGFEDVTLDKPRLNAAQVACRDNIDGLNKAVDEMCVREFGVHYVKGKGTHKSRTVEELKIASAKAAAELADREEQRRLDAEAKANAAQKAAEAAESGRKAAEEARAKAEAERDAMEGDSFVHKGTRYLGLAGVSNMLREESSKAGAAREQRKELEAQNAELTSKNVALADEVKEAQARRKAMADAIVKIQAELDAAETRQAKAESATKAAEAQREEAENARLRAQETLQAVEKQKQALNTALANMRAQKASQDAREADLRKREADAERVREAVEAERARLKELLGRADRLIWEVQEDADIREREWDVREREREKQYKDERWRLIDWLYTSLYTIVNAAVRCICRQTGVPRDEENRITKDFMRDYIDRTGTGHGRRGGWKGGVGDLVREYGRVELTDAPKWKDRSEAYIAPDLSTQQRRVDEMRRDAERKRNESEGLGA